MQPPGTGRRLGTGGGLHRPAPWSEAKDAGGGAKGGEGTSRDPWVQRQWAAFGFCGLLEESQMSEPHVTHLPDRRGESTTK